MALDSAHELALDQAQIVSPFGEKVKYNLYAAFVPIAAHLRRHLWQAEQVLLAKTEVVHSTYNRS